MSTRLRLLDTQLEEIHLDLSRPHLFAAERVGFLTCGLARVASDSLVLLGNCWHRVADEDYLDDPRVGACIGPAAFRKILQYAYHEAVSVLHVHRHDHYGTPSFSSIDTRSAREYVPGFFNVRRSHPHGALVLSLDNGAGEIWLPSQLDPRPIDRVDIIGVPLRRWP